MLEFFRQNIATILICAVLAVIFGLMLWSLLRDKKRGKSSCCGGCAGCAMAGYCHPKPDQTPPNKDTPSEKNSESANHSSLHDSPTNPG